jgi:hypothetical protein
MPKTLHQNVIQGDLLYLALEEKTQTCLKGKTI